jgi:hypothetical protein
MSRIKEDPDGVPAKPKIEDVKAHTGQPKRSVLIINPNTTEAMTDGLKPLVDSLGFDTVSTHKSHKPTC